MTYGGGGFGGDLNLKAQLVNGVCPHCHNSVVFVSLCKDFFRCMACGADLEQKVNGKISYIPAGTNDITFSLKDHAHGKPS